MEKFTHLYDFIDFAKANRKYPESTANNLKSALKIFEKELNPEELKSINMVADSIEEIFRSVAIANKDKSIISLNTYKARLLKVINDYKRYGADPSKIQKWVIKTRNSTPLLINKDKSDKNKITLSNHINTGVNNPCACLPVGRDNIHRIDLSFDCGKAQISIPKNITAKDAEIIKNVIDSLIAD